MRPARFINRVGLKLLQVGWYNARVTVTVTASEWDAFVASHPDGHILQTPAWGDLKCAFGWSAARVGIKKDGVVVAGAQVLFRPLPTGLYTIAYIPKGPLVDWSNAPLVEFLFKSLDNVAQSANAVFLKIEPPDSSKNLEAQLSNFQLPTSNLKSASNIQPRRSIVVDLRSDEETILAAMKQKTRYNVRLAAKKDVVVTASEDIEAFCALMKVTGERDEFGVHDEKYYRKAYELFRPLDRAQLFVATFEGKPLAALMLFVLGKRAWYFYGGSSNEERNRMPAYLLQWEAMRWAKARGVEEYDLWGVPDEEEDVLEANFETRHEGLWGVYRFKRGLGGKLVRAPGAVDRVYSGALYKLYEMYMGRRGVE
jgi:lipid II:glycine glycyltransferase (peptidoglycan interpeptide bridge formation enzyme)